MDQRFPINTPAEESALASVAGIAGNLNARSSFRQIFGAQENYNKLSNDQQTRLTSPGHVRKHIVQQEKAVSVKAARLASQQNAALQQSLG